MEHSAKALTITLLLLPLIAIGSGKINGRVIDKESKQPLIGANVVIVGTSYGAATDLQGEFSIIEVPIGVFTVRAGYIGYSAVEVQNVRICNGLTTEVNFELTTKEIELQLVTIVSERPLINKSSTNAVRIMTNEDMLSTPARGLDQLLALQAGVILQDGNLLEIDRLQFSNPRNCSPIPQ